jgi:hypothetical protein
MSDVREWQSHPSYTHEREAGAIQQLLTNPETVLFIGSYGATLSSFFENTQTKHLLARDVNEVPDSVDHAYNVSSYNDLPSLDDYDGIIAPKVDWPKRPTNLLQSLQGAVGNDGQVIIETVDETSEYTSVLEQLKPEIKGAMFNERLLLLELLTKAFSVERYQVSTTYHFQSIDDYILYFNQHANHEWGRKLSKAEKQRLGKFGEQVGYDNLGERAVLLSCKP